MFARLRDIGKRLAVADVIWVLGSTACIAALGMVRFVIALRQGDLQRLPGILVGDVIVISMLAFICWLLQDAKRASKRIGTRRRGRALPHGDISDALGIADGDSWPCLQ
jgi:hypothetical protein